MSQMLLVISVNARNECALEEIPHQKLVIIKSTKLFYNCLYIFFNILIRYFVLQNMEIHCLRSVECLWALVAFEWPFSTVVHHMHFKHMGAPKCFPTKLTIIGSLLIFSTMCMWSLNPVCVNALSHTSHLWDFSPVCTTIWLPRVKETLKDFSHWLHLNWYFILWDIKWFFNEDF